MMTALAKYSGLDLDDHGAWRSAASHRRGCRAYGRSGGRRARAGGRRAIWRTHGSDGRCARAGRARCRRTAVLPRPDPEHVLRALDAFVLRRRKVHAAHSRAARRGPPPRCRSGVQGARIFARAGARGHRERVQHEGKRFAARETRGHRHEPHATRDRLSRRARRTRRERRAVRRTARCWRSRRTCRALRARRRR